MTSLNFQKYQGAGNDFIVIDDLESSFDEDDTVLVRRLCDRRYGIGADGLMLLRKHPNYDFQMIYFNADGHHGSMCGNGARCIVAFAKHKGLITDKTAFLAADGVHHAAINPSGDWVNLQMTDVNTVARDKEAYIINTGSPHYVCLVKGLADFPVYEHGQIIRNSESYRTEGINVNFVEQDTDGYFVRTYERGVEDETLACGTGATAAAIAMAIHRQQEGRINTRIRVKGGELTIRFKRTDSRFSDIWLEGPAKHVFQGEISIDDTKDQQDTWN